MALEGLRDFHQTEMSEMNFPSGQWVGFYTYNGSKSRHLMDLLLEFHNGRVSGEGADNIGFFGIDGHYASTEGECQWIKTYLGAHTVDYVGYREQKGIWGTWSIQEFRGGFHIWPIGEGIPAEEMVEVNEEQLTSAFPGTGRERAVVEALR